MTITEAVMKYYSAGDLNCAEAVLHGLNDVFELNLNAKDYKLLGAYGAGCGCGSLCGAVAAGVAVIGLLNIEDRAKTSPAQPKAGLFVREVQKRYGSEHCSVLRKQFFTKEQRCAVTVSNVTDILDEMRLELFGR